MMPWWPLIFYFPCVCVSVFESWLCMGALITLDQGLTLHHHICETTQCPNIRDTCSDPWCEGYSKSHQTTTHLQAPDAVGMCWGLKTWPSCWEHIKDVTQPQKQLMHGKVLETRGTARLDRPPLIWNSPHKGCSVKRKPPGTVRILQRLVCCEQSKQERKQRMTVAVQRALHFPLSVWDLQEARRRAL